MSRGRHEPRTFPRARDRHEEGERTTAPGMLRAAAAQCTPGGALPLLPSLPTAPPKARRELRASLAPPPSLP